MKILFGINNDDTVKGIVDFYEEKFKEKLEYKNVYYFKQFISELSTDEYDRAVVLEELEKFPTNNYAQIDDYLFKNVDAMSDNFDAKSIIYIASDRRRLGDGFLSRLFNLGIYSVLTGQERTKGRVTDLINKPILKKDVKKFYDVTGDSAYKKSEVSELEIQRIISYYKNQNGVTDKYNEIFDRISTQYTNEQMRVIINFLPEDVKIYLAANNEKYNNLINTVVNVQPPSQEGVEITTTTEMKTILDTVKDSKVVEIIKEPQIIEKILVKKTTPVASVVTEVLEKEVVRSVYEVPKDYIKVVCFVGAPKVGTTFCVNAIGTYLAKNKVKTAIVDLTRKRDTYTIYTYDNEGKRSIAAESLKYASNGYNEPLVYEKLSIYTGMPGEDRKIYNPSKVIDTITQKNNVVLIDTDFTTPPDYFRLCQEIYVVQDMDVLNIQQTTMFIRELKSRGIPMSKLRIIVNKHVKCALTVKDLIDGIATYTSYDLKMYDELFSPNSIPSYIVPFDMDNYKKYTEMLFKYVNKFTSFTDEFKTSVEKIINQIYPIGRLDTTKKTPYAPAKRSLSSSIFGNKKILSPIASEMDNIEKEVK